MKPPVWSFGLLLLLFLPACTGAPQPAAPPPTTPAEAAPRAEAVAPAAVEGPPWVEAAVREALEWEVMPGTTAVEDPTRPPALRAFFLGHPEYEAADRRAALADLACAFGTEEAHKRLSAPAAPAPYVVELTDPSGRVVLAHASSWCTSDDWSWFTNEVGEALKGRGIPYAYAGAEYNELVLRRGEAEVARFPLSGQGYLATELGRAPTEIGHSMVEDVLPALWAYYGSGSGEPSPDARR